ncbi:MAG: hypothetical protein WCQ77_06175, partial [Planctomycetota bacterium]
GGQSLAGDITGAGSVNATTSGNVTITNTRGGITLTSSPGQITGNVLNVTAQNSSSLNTNIAGLAANITGGSQSLAIFQTGRDLSVTSSAVRTNNGSLTLDVASPNNLTVAGAVNVGSATVTLNAPGGSLNATGTISAGTLNVTANSTSTLNTAVGTLNANITGASQSLTVNEADSLTIGAGGVRATNAAINLTLATGSLSGSGNINAGTGNVTLNTSSGGITLNTSAGQVIGNVLSIRANSSSFLNTNVSTLTARLTGTGQNLTVTEANGLTIGSGNVSTVNGVIAITTTTGSINGTGSLTAGTTGNIALSAPAGNVTLANTANQVTGNALTVTALNSSALNTAVNSLSADISGTGSLTINEANNLTVTQASTANGAINLTTSANSVVNIASINARAGTNGNLTVTNGNLFIDTPGIIATQTVNLTQVQSVTILSGDIKAPVVLLPSGQSLNYLVYNSGDSGPGSVRERITLINAGGTRSYSSTILVNSLMTVSVGPTALPTMTVQMNVQGNNLLTLDGTLLGTSASGFTITSTSTMRSTISGVTFQRFAGAGIDLQGARNISVTGVTVTNSGIGFRASNNLTGSGVFSSSFTNNVVGGMLLNAQNFRVGVNPNSSALQGNTFTGSTTGLSGASRTGLSISGTTTSTVVKANTFSGYPTAVSLVAATGLMFGGSLSDESNSISNASTAGIYASGFCTSSFVIKTTFIGVPTAKQYLVSTSRNLTIQR